MEQSVTVAVAQELVCVLELELESLEVESVEVGPSVGLLEGSVSKEGSPSGPMVMAGNGDGKPAGGPPGGYTPGKEKPGKINPPGPGGQNQQPCLLSGRTGTGVALPELVTSMCEPKVTVESVIVLRLMVGNTLKVVIGPGADVVLLENVPVVVSDGGPVGVATPDPDEEPELVDVVLPLVGELPPLLVVVLLPTDV